jgi:hypothetical protein
MRRIVGTIMAISGILVAPPLWAELAGGGLRPKVFFWRCRVYRHGPGRLAEEEQACGRKRDFKLADCNVARGPLKEVRRA